MKFFCDLDGTLIDVSQRHYSVYREITTKFGGNPLSQDIYWDLKRNKVKWSKLLPLSDLSINVKDEYLKAFILKIEDPLNLKIDRLFPGVKEILSSIINFSDIYLVSLRRNRLNLIKEVDDLGLSAYFTDILSGHSENDGFDVKIELIKDKLGKDSGVIIGDTEADIITGKKLNLLTIAVTSGIRSTSFLKELNPDFLISSVADVQDLIKNIKR